MKTVLIIYPHWPPSNLAGVHRPRLIANFLTGFGWHPVILTVSPEYYEEAPDPQMALTVAPGIEVIRTKARKVRRKGRLIGDIGIRAFFHLKREALAIISDRKVDFLWIPIPSFYTAVLGRIIHDRTGVPYGIDYIDPWVGSFTDRRLFSKGWLANAAAKVLERYAVKKAALISGVSESYYRPVLERNFSGGGVRHAAMPYGFDPRDHEVEMPGLPLPWDSVPGCRPLVYAGAFLPRARQFLEALFASVRALETQGQLDGRFRFYFLGTGNYRGETIADIALRNKVGHLVVEVRERFPYLHVINFLGKAHGVLVIGSTEKHYTASKIFQALLSRRPVFSVLHRDSTAAAIMERCEAAHYLVRYSDGQAPEELCDAVSTALQAYLDGGRAWMPRLEELNEFSAERSAEKLSRAMDAISGGKSPNP